MTTMRSKGYSLESICSFVGISRQAYHKRIKRQSSKEQLYQDLERLVLLNRKERSRVGLRTMYYKENMSCKLGVNQFEQQMSTLGYALKPYRSYLKTTDSRGHYYKFDNLISGIDITKENQVIVGDITYYMSSTKLYYIFHFQDYYTLEVKGLIGSSTMEGLYAEKCLRQVFAYNNQRNYNHKLIIHTDAGSQYRSHKFQSMLRKSKTLPSHASNCFENGLSERCNGIVKNEYLVDYDIKSVTQLNAVLRKIKQQINEVWPSKTLGYKTPKEFAIWTRAMKECDRPIRTVKIVQ
jgi:transposase InsO family protein